MTNQPYNVLAKLDSEEKKILNALQSHYILSHKKMVSKGKTICLSIREAAKSLNINPNKE